MPIIVNLDVMLARRKMRSKDLAKRIGITEQNLSLLKSGKVKGVRFDTLDKICEVLRANPAICWNIALPIPAIRFRRSRRLRVSRDEKAIPSAEPDTTGSAGPNGLMRSPRLNG